MIGSSAEVTTVDRRRHERLQPLRRVVLRCAGGAMGVFGWGMAVEAPTLLDLSSGGALVAMPGAPEPGFIVRLDFRTDEGESFEALGEIRWSRRGASGAGGIHCGVLFFKSTPRRRQEIQDLCRRARSTEGGRLLPPSR